MSSTWKSYNHDTINSQASHLFPFSTTIPHAEHTHPPRLERYYDYGQQSADLPLGAAASQQTTSASASASLLQAESSIPATNPATSDTDPFYLILRSEHLLSLLSQPGVLYGTGALPALPSGYACVVVPPLSHGTLPLPVAEALPLRVGHQGTVSMACTGCREIKKKCDRGSPCKRCSKYGLECIYLERKRRRTVAARHSMNRHNLTSVGDAQVQLGGPSNAAVRPTAAGPLSAASVANMAAPFAPYPTQAWF
ncbi:hypothetical protein C8Q74DRAFT_1372432 [Fomes fomentarius]|nr:hypothetical protein C8Q74DRAFT_1372432 [Fomes fomentarius]